MTSKFITIIAALLMAGCAAKQPPSSTSPAADQTSKPSQQRATQSAPAARKHIDLNNMEPGFLYLAAQNALKQHNPGLAIELLKALVHKDPTAIDPHIQLTRLLIENKQNDQAQQHLDALLATPTLDNNQQQAVQLMQVQLDLINHNSQRALTNITAFLHDHPDHAGARELQIKILSLQHRYDDALKATRAAIARQDRPAYRLLEAQLLMQLNQPRAADKALRAMQRLSPDAEMAVLLRSQLASKQQHPKQAETILRQYIAHHPQSFRVTHALGKLLIEQQRLGEAIEVFRQAVARSGNNPILLRQLGMLYLQHQAYDEAEATFRTLVKDPQATAADTFYLAGTLEAEGKHDEAAKLYATIDPDTPIATEAALRLAVIDARNNRLEEANRRLQQILAKHPENIEAHLLRSSIQLQQQRYQQLLDDSEPLLHKKTHLPDQLLFNRAVAQQELKRYPALEQTLHQLLKQNPNHADALNFLGYSYAERGTNLSEAKMLIQRALLIKPNDGYYLDSLAWVYYQSGDYPQAMRTQQRALKAQPNDAEITGHYGDILWRSGNHEAARSAWQKALKLHHPKPEQLRQKIRAGLPAQ